MSARVSTSTVLRQPPCKRLKKQQDMSCDTHATLFSQFQLLDAAVWLKDRSSLLLLVVSRVTAMKHADKHPHTLSWRTDTGRNGRYLFTVTCQLS